MYARPRYCHVTSIPHGLHVHSPSPPNVRVGERDIYFLTALPKSITIFPIDFCFFSQRQGYNVILCPFRSCLPWSIHINLPSSNGAVREFAYSQPCPRITDCCQIRFIWQAHYTRNIWSPTPSRSPSRENRHRSHRKSAHKSRRPSPGLTSPTPSHGPLAGLGPGDTRTCTQARDAKYPCYPYDTGSKVNLGTGAQTSEPIPVTPRGSSHGSRGPDIDHDVRCRQSRG